MKDKRDGPRLVVKASCQGCVYERSAYYTAQSDTGYNVECVHPQGVGTIGTSWDTPDWCPLMPAARLGLVDDLKAAVMGDHVVCTRSLYKSTYGKNALIAGRRYPVVHRDANEVFIVDETRHVFGPFVRAGTPPALVFDDYLKERTS